jgi:flavin reductase (DIM6/NTAB) family NADH-FMN oxidoreductase RutF
MSKVDMKPIEMMVPAPLVLVSCADAGSKPNIVTIAWTGVVCSSPAMLHVGIRPSRYSHKLIKNSGEFVINIPTAEMVDIVDWCGTHSGADFDKFAKTGLTPMKGKKVAVPIIKECPINVECVVRHSYRIGAHEHFIGEVVAINADEEIMVKKNSIDIAKLNPLAYCHVTGEYWTLGKAVASAGFAKNKF